MAAGEVQGLKSDLGVRTLSALAMAAVAAVALWLGGWVWLIFVLAVSLGVLFEWTRLYLAFTPSFLGRLLWAVLGLVYIGGAGLALVALRREGVGEALFPILLVIATDVGAYFTGRTLRGPKIAPAISPSKTWSGLIGGMLAAGVVAAVSDLAFAGDRMPGSMMLGQIFVFGAAMALFAQAGDFFQSWMKRRAGVKDSGALLPGHGGLFDRIDGLLAVLVMNGVLFLILRGMGGA